MRHSTTSALLVRLIMAIIRHDMYTSSPYLALPHFTYGLDSLAVRCSGRFSSVQWFLDVTNRRLR